MFSAICVHIVPKISLQEALRTQKPWNRPDRLVASAAVAFSISRLGRSGRAFFLYFAHKKIDRLLDSPVIGADPDGALGFNQG